MPASNRKGRSVLALAAALFVLAQIAVVVPTADAADVDLVVNISSDASAYQHTDTMNINVEVASLTASPTDGPVELRIQIPNTVNFPTTWIDSLTCISTGGATCPTITTVEGDTLVATLDPIPGGGLLEFALPVSAELPGGYVTSGPMTILATASTSPADNETSSDTNSSYQNIQILPVDVQWSIITSSPAPVAAPGNTTVAYTMTVSNSGVDPTSLLTDLRLGAGQGSGSASAFGYLDGMGFASITCVGTTGTADCADLRSIQSGQPADPQPPTLYSPTGSFGNTPTRQTPGIVLLPGGSSYTLELVVNTGLARCSNTPGAFRKLTLTARIRSLETNTATFVESPNSSADNRTTSETDIGAINCLTGDLELRSLTQPPAQTAAWLEPGGPFQYTATYVNNGADDSPDSSVEFLLNWPTDAASLPTGDANVACVATGGAQCPTDPWTVGPTLNPLSPNQIRWNNQIPLLPAGDSITLTFIGTGGGDTVRSCRPGRTTVESILFPDATFNDTNYSLTSPTRGNNRRTSATRTNIGVDCGASATHDDEVTLTGPFSDPAATVPAAQPLDPGSTIYFRTDLINHVDGLDFAEFTGYFRLYPWAFNHPAIESGPHSRPGELWNSPEPGQPQGLPMDLNRNDPAGGDYFTGVICTPGGGATCPTRLAPHYVTQYDGQTNEILGASGWEATGQLGADDIVLPDGGSLTFITPFRIRDFRPQYTGRCYGTTDTILRAPVQVAVGAVTDPVSNDRDSSHDLVALPIELLIPSCTGALSIDKTSLGGVGTDRRTEFEITVTNDAAVPLDLPKLVDSPRFGSPQGATIECVSTTLGAECPNFTPEPFIEHRGDGSQGPSEDLFNFVWGSPGASTMPAGSSVTFKVTFIYSSSATLSSQIRNVATFSADPLSATASWPSATATANTNVTQAPPLNISKRVSDVRPHAGETVIFTVDILNTTGYPLSGLTFRDTMSSLLSSANPAGFGNFSCRALTPADGVLPIPIVMGTATCPVFSTDPTGISGTGIILPLYSGLRLTYTAVVPSGTLTVPNIAELSYLELEATSGDVTAQVNFQTAVVTVSGTIWNDGDGSASGTRSGIRTDSEAGTSTSGLTAVLVDQTTGLVISLSAVAADGTYIFVDVDYGTDVMVYVTADGTQPAIGEPAAAPVVPPGWVSTSPMASESFNTGTSNSVDTDFGLQRPPETADVSLPTVANPGGVGRIPVPTLVGSDSEDGNLGSGNEFVINTLPDPSKGVLYYDGNAVEIGQKITNYDPSLLTFDPVDGSVTASFTYSSVDAAGAVDQTPSTATISVSAASAQQTTSTTQPTTTTIRATPTKLAYTGAGGFAQMLTIGLTLLVLGGLLISSTRRQQRV